MKYYVKRDDQEYGPFSQADLQRCIVRGSVDAADLARGEAMHRWVPVAEIGENFSVLSAPGPVDYDQASTDSPAAALYGVLSRDQCRPGRTAFRCWFSALLHSAFFLGCGISSKLAL
jgi:hypothetical protein